MDVVEGMVENELSVSVQEVNGSFKFFIDDIQQNSIKFQKDQIYKFDWSKAPDHPLKFSTTPDGTHRNGVEFLDDIIVDHNKMTTTVKVNKNGQDLYYFNEDIPQMGGKTSVELPFINDYLELNTNIVDGDVVGKTSLIKEIYKSLKLFKTESGSYVIKQI